MEQPLLAASLRSRQDYELIRQYIDVRLSTYSKPFQIVMAKVGDYYKRDAEAPSVDTSILLAQVAESIRNDKHVARFTELVNEALATTGSDVNVRACILMAKQQEVGDKLSQQLAMDSTNPKVDVLVEELRHLRSLTSLEELDQGLEAFESVDLAAMMNKEYDPENQIKVYPISVNDRLDGGAHRGHHIVVFARPETGKSAFTINASCGFGRHGRRTLYFINEDRPEDIIIRHVSNLSGMVKHEVRDNPARAQELAMQNGWGNIIVVSAAPGTPGQIRDYIERYDPDCIIIDQLRNLSMKAENRTNQLEQAATAVRNIAKEANVLALSVTQAGDSAENKLILEQGDVDYSNTGIPAQADTMIGIGVDAEKEAEGLRIINLPKNKIGGVHENFPVRINPSLSRITSV